MRVIQFAAHNVRHSLVRSGVVPAAWVAGFVLLLAGCTQTNQTATTSPETSPSTSPVTTTPGTTPTPTASPPAAASPSPKASPKPAKLIIKSLPYHLGEVGVTYGTVVVVAAGGVKPYKWSIQAGALPPGLALSTGGSTTGKPTNVGNYSFSVRVDDSAGAAAGAPSSIMVFRQLVFNVTTATCGNAPKLVTDCSTALHPPLRIPYSGGTPGAKLTIKITGVTGGSIIKPVRACVVTAANPTTSPPPGMSVSASGGFMTLSAGPPDGTTWCHYRATITFVLVNPSPCGAGFLCTSSNTLSVVFNL